ATELIPLRFHDATTDIRTHDTVIRLGHDGRVAEVRFNGHIAGVFDLATDKLAPYYSAYRKFMALSRSDAYRTTLRLGGGEMVVFDNRRVLHGRDAFDPSTGYRRLRGCYVDRGEWDSRMRVLARNAAAPKE
ncbi:MAG: TauD/TfdA family dioxygenase, partial [Pseudomonadota bacterium]